MKKVFLSKSILAAGVLGAIVSANAAINDPKPYIGANLDYNMYSWTSEFKDKPASSTSVTDATANTRTDTSTKMSSIKKKSLGLSPIVGVKLMDNVAVEFGYSFIKKPKATLDTTITVTDTAATPPTVTSTSHEFTKVSAKIKNMYLDVLGSMPVAEQFEVIGGLGIGKLNIKQDDLNIKNKMSWRAKLAGQYSVNSNIAARLTATYQKANNKTTIDSKSVKLMKNMTSIGLGVFYTF